MERNAKGERAGWGRGQRKRDSLRAQRRESENVAEMLKHATYRKSTEKRARGGRGCGTERCEHVGEIHVEVHGTGRTIANCRGARWDRMHKF